MATATSKKTEVGSYFIANYPPFSQWSVDGLQHVRAAMNAPPLRSLIVPGDKGAGSEGATPLGLYLHIPFCRKRCKFCYFRVYTDKNSHEVEQYVAALSREIELVSKLPVMGGRPFRFV
jgi:oxygen-independent coproporphyrinogen III oxidase